MPRVPVKKYSVRCLGPGPEHTCEITHPTRKYGMCRNCQVKIHQLYGTRAVGSARECSDGMVQTHQSAAT